MHVVMVSDHETTGGAAIAASRLADALVDLGHRVSRVVAVDDGRVHHWTTHRIRAERIPFRVLSRALPRVGPGVARRRVTRRFEALLDDLRPDVVNLHNLHGAPTKGWGLPIAVACAGKVPSFWTLHDMWSFTGSCAYAFDCDRFVTGCDAGCWCPAALPRVTPNQLTAEWHARRRLLQAHPDLVAIAPSRWLRDRAVAGLWSSHRVEVVPNGVALGQYRPYDPARARRRLGIDPKGFVAIAPTLDPADPRKGSSLLFRALPMLPPNRRPMILFAGRKPTHIFDKETSVRALGMIQDPTLMAQAYSAADVSIHPSLADNFPNTIVESLGCGTPAIGFNVGGIPELIEDGVTGWLAGEPSAENLAAAIERAAGDILAGDPLGARSRTTAERRFAAQSQAARYEALFSVVL